MNTLQKLIIAIAVLIAATFVIYPPWMEIYLAEGGKSRVDYPRSFLWNKPEPTHREASKGVKIDTSEISKPLFFVGIIAFVAYVAAATRKKAPTDSAQPPH